MSVFTDGEVAYLRSQPLGRLATVGRDGRPAVRPVGVVYDPEAEVIVIGGAAGTGMAGSKKFRDARRRPDVAFVIDDIAAVDPWTPRGIEIRGHAETYDEGGEQVGERLDAPFPFDSAWIRIRPRRILSWGIDNGSYEMSARDVP
ncbi:PPOX class F420-dependent oxidoreductase [Planobispora rosea]|uniref:PPOX class F420-dependent oxidoreductase n=1 Tax=Planobispora rosea TaxID=35762 RepID=A0A8J3WA99_PLARO|nr:PPOX class F420-dependent oxidoreductase [Planobispora rosea]GGS50826.1 PPOX class F420-dependent oxidoreductase [Planobispora rosea]GIH82564.1 PPOX class F420-dependent oxidoreductase [Planobispora rosea]